MQTGPAILREFHLPNAKTTNLVGEQARNFIIFDRSVMAFSRQRELKDDALGSSQGVVPPFESHRAATRGRHPSVSGDLLYHRAIGV
jgi:hypothetical protein